MVVIAANLYLFVRIVVMIMNMSRSSRRKIYHS